NLPPQRKTAPAAARRAGVRRPVPGALLGPDGRVASFRADAVAADQGQPIVLAGVQRELGLVVAAGPAVVSDIGRPLVLLEDGRVVSLTVDAIAADPGEAVFVVVGVIELLLILRRGHTVAGVPSGAACLLPDRRVVSRAVGGGVAADQRQAVLLVGPL